LFAESAMYRDSVGRELQARWLREVSPLGRSAVSFDALAACADEGPDRARRGRRRERSCSLAKTVSCWSCSDEPAAMPMRLELIVDGRPRRGMDEWGFVDE
jgi:hypothetical protein